MKLVHPSPLTSLKHLLEVLNLFAELTKVTRNELRSIVSHDLLRHAKSANYISPDETFDVRVFSLCVCLCFDPLCKIISEDKQVFTLAKRAW